MAFDPILLIILCLCGLSTYLLRLIPILLQRRKQHKPLPASVHAAFAALGPAAITGLLIVSLAPLLKYPTDQSSLDALSLQAHMMHILPVAMACSIILGLSLLQKNAIFATFSGVLVYGMCHLLFA